VIVNKFFAANPRPCALNAKVTEADGSGFFPAGPSKRPFEQNPQPALVPTSKTRTPLSLQRGGCKVNPSGAARSQSKTPDLASGSISAGRFVALPKHSASELPISECRQLTGAAARGARKTRASLRIQAPAHPNPSRNLLARCPSVRVDHCAPLPPHRLVQTRPASRHDHAKRPRTPEVMARGSSSLMVARHGRFMVGRYPNPLNCAENNSC